MQNKSVNSNIDSESAKALQYSLDFFLFHMLIRKCYFKNSVLFALVLMSMHNSHSIEKHVFIAFLCTSMYSGFQN